MAAIVSILTGLTIYSLFLFIGFSIEWEEPEDIWGGIIIGGLIASFVLAIIAYAVMGGCSS